MPLTGRQIKELQAALLDAFDYSSLKQMVLTELDTDLEEIALGGSLTEVTLKLITWAEQTGRTQALVTGAVNANQSNTRLKQFAAQHAATLTAASAPDTQQPQPVQGKVSVAAVIFGGLALLLFLGLAAAGLLRTAGNPPQETTPTLTANPPEQATVNSNAPPTFTSDYVYEPGMIEQIELETEVGMLPTETITDFLQLTRVALGDLDAGGRAYDVRLRLKNTSARPVLLDLTQRFFSFEDDQGRKAELAYFCCDTKGDLLPVGQSRTLHMIFLEAPAWEGEETSAERLIFRVRGLKPVVRAAWQLPILTMTQ